MRWVPRWFACAVLFCFTFTLTLVESSEGEQGSVLFDSIEENNWQWHVQHTDTFPAWDSDWQALVKSILKQQQPSDCRAETTKFLKVRMGGDLDLEACQAAGFWGKFMRLAGALGWAFLHKRTLSYDPLDSWVSNVDPLHHWLPGCDTGGPLCFFESPTSCTADDVDPQSEKDGPIRIPANLSSLSQRVVAWSVCPHQNKRDGTFLHADANQNDFWGAAARPRKYLKHSDAWWMSAFVYVLLRPRPELLRLFAATRRDLEVQWAGVHRPVDGANNGGGGPMADFALHVRRGDKYPGSPTEHARVLAEEYLSVVRYVQHQSKLNPSLSPSADGNAPTLATGSAPRIYLATDEPMVATAAAHHEPRYRIRAVSDTPRRVWRLTTGQYNVTAESIGSLRDVWLMAQCRHLVLTHTSALSKTAYLLAYAWRGPVWPLRLLFLFCFSETVSSDFSAFRLLVVTWV